jgi:transcriptional regulator with XRE-family HTH domain
MKLRAIVARNLRILRKQKGFSQEELAFRAGINRNYVGQIEREEKSPTVDVVEKLAFSLSVGADELLSHKRWKS